MVLETSEREVGLQAILRSEGGRSGIIRTTFRDGPCPLYLCLLYKIKITCASVERKASEIEKSDSREGESLYIVDSQIVEVVARRL